MKGFCKTCDKESDMLIFGECPDCRHEDRENDMNVGDQR